MAVGTTLGADPEDLQALAGTLDAYANRIEGMQGSLRSLVYSLAWEGPNAADFRESWEQESRVLFANITAGLHDRATVLRTNAIGQQEASTPIPGGPTTLSEIENLVDAGLFSAAALRIGKDLNALGDLDTAADVGRDVMDVVDTGGRADLEVDKLMSPVDSLDTGFAIVGVAVSSYLMVQDIRSHDYDDAIADGVSAVGSGLMLAVPPPFDAIGAAMVVGSVVYQERAVIGQGARVIADSASKAADYLADHEASLVHKILPF